MTPPELEFLKSLTVLYVEDDPDIHARLDFFLKRHVGVLLVAHDGAEGARVWEERQPDIVITDILMPTMDGLAMTRQIRERDEEIPIIVTTAYSDEEFFIRSIDLGIDRYVLKPTDPATLHRALTHCARSLWRRREKETADRYVRFVLDIQPSPLLVTGKGQLEYINRAFLNYLGFPSREDFLASGIALESLMQTRTGLPLSGDGEAGGWIGSLLKAAREDPILFLRRPDQEDPLPIPFAITGNALPELEKHIFSFADVTHLEKEKQELEEKAFTDALTGICNRARLQVILNTELRRAHRHDLPLSVVMCDIDHFKKINDVYGHQAGDDVLRQMVGIMRVNLRAEDLLARWGGEEFMVVSPQSDLESTRLLAEKLRALVEKSHFPAVGQITCSFGVAEREPGDTIRILTERADKALYAAKTGGRNRVELQTRA
ncbi:MAG: diguanylate cyclase [Magnetococcales bacterium]|nr:diguanylate cyclase [Magnetococcales bacterium]